MPDENQDKWSEWLLERRFGDDSEQQQRVREKLHPIRDQVLDNAEIESGMRLLDIGTGDGLIAFGALDRPDGASLVIFSDISRNLLAHSRSLAQEGAALDRCAFLLAPAESLPLAEASVDAITTRSVLIYIEAKQRAISEFYRVLKPGGRLSVFEPINEFSHTDDEDQLWGFDVTPIKEIASKVRAVYERHQPPESNPMLTFDERDLFQFADEAGFEEIDLEFNATQEPGDHAEWEMVIEIAPNPNAPTLGEAIEEALTPKEADRFVDHLRPLVEAEDQPVRRTATAYLQAVKP